MASSGQALALSRAIVAATRAPHCSNAHTDFLASQQQRLESVPPRRKAYFPQLDFGYITCSFTFHSPSRSRILLLKLSITKAALTTGMAARESQLYITPSKSYNA